MRPLFFAVFPTFAFFALASCTSLTAPPTPDPAPTQAAQPKEGSTAAATATARDPHAGMFDQKPKEPVAEKPDPSLGIKDVVVGKGEVAKAGDTVKMQYTGTLTDGKEFDSSRKPGRTPFEVRLGMGHVIKGWDQGIPGMRVGGKRILTIPYPLAYGEMGRPPVIPPKATLVFDVELLEIVKK
ncbi:MAG: FKBP-type peptidyl-prolyl cis-trans isomerase [Polyangiaceae bacterium]